MNCYVFFRSVMNNDKLITDNKLLLLTLIDNKQQTYVSLSFTTTITLSEFYFFKPMYEISNNNNQLIS